MNVRDLLGDRSKHKRNNGIKMVLKGIVWECLDWLHFCRESDHLTHRWTLWFHKILAVCSNTKRQLHLSNRTRLSGVGVLSVLVWSRVLSAREDVPWCHDFHTVRSIGLAALTQWMEGQICGCQSVSLNYRRQLYWGIRSVHSLFICVNYSYIHRHCSLWQSPWKASSRLAALEILTLI